MDKFKEWWKTQQVISCGEIAAKMIWEAATLAERERCAMVCDNMHLYTGFDCAEAIRRAG